MPFRLWRPSRAGLKASALGRAALILLLLGWLPASSPAGEREEQRIRAGLDLFASLLAADLDIAHKQHPDGKLLLVLAYVDDRRAAEEGARYLRRIEKIHGIPIRVEPAEAASLTGRADPPPAGIFLSQPIAGGLEALVRYGENHRAIVFSPFEGDVERGVLGGIAINDRILPYVNVRAMRASRIRIKPFFLRIAKRYE